MSSPDLVAWAVEWRSRNILDGATRRLTWDRFDRFHLFPTRRLAREYIETTYGYIRDRPDLRREPFGWRMPVAVRVVVMRPE